MEPDPVKGLEEIAIEFKDDPLTHKAILGMIVMCFPKHSDIVLDYLRIHYIVEHNKKPRLEEHLKFFPALRRLILSQLENVNLLLEQKNYLKADETIGRIAEEIEELSHSVTFGKTEKKTSEEKIEIAIKGCTKNLDRLHDFVIVANQDKILKEMIALKKAMEELETEIQRYIVSNF
jgi:hypothetical protein